MGFKDARKEALPKWLRGDGEPFSEVLGEEQDNELLRLKEAAKLRYPTFGDNTGLPYMTREREMFRAPIEDDASHAKRLLRAPLYWYWGGTKSAMYSVLEPYDDSAEPPTQTDFYPRSDVDVNEKDLRARMDPATTTKVAVINQAEGPVTQCEEWYSEFVIVFDSRGGPFFGPADWDAGWSWDDGHLWDTTMTVADARYLLLMIRRFKQAQSYPVRLAIWLDDATPFWNFLGDWDGGWVWGDAPTSDTPYLTIGHVWEQTAGLGGWIGDAEPQATTYWDDGWKWQGFENPLLLGT